MNPPGDGAAAGTTNGPAVSRAIEDELQRIEESATYSAQSQFEQAKQWRLMNFALGIPASVLAAVSGATALTEATGRWFSGVVALIAAALSAAMTTVNAAQRSSHAQTSANEFLSIQTAARQTRLIDLPARPVSETRAALADLTKRLDEQNKVADAPTRRAYRRGKKNIETGGQSYAVDEAPGTPETSSRA